MPTTRPSLVRAGVAARVGVFAAMAAAVLAVTACSPAAGTATPVGPGASVSTAVRPVTDQAATDQALTSQDQFVTTPTEPPVTRTTGVRPTGVPRPNFPTTRTDGPTEPGPVTTQVTEWVAPTVVVPTIVVTTELVTTELVTTELVVTTSAATPATETVAPPATTSSQVEEPRGPDLTAANTDYGSLTFRTPSGNIACDIAAESSVRCDIREFSYDLPDGMEGCDFGDRGHSLAVEPGYHGYFPCVSDTVLGQDAPELGYRSWARYGGISCLSDTNGVTCTEDASGHGFRLARASFELF